MVTTITLPDLGYSFDAGNVTINGIQDVDGNGGALNVQGGNGTGHNGAGGGIRGGDSDTQSGGDAVVVAGNANGVTGAGGNVQIAGGYSAGGIGGSVSIAGGHSYGTGQIGGDTLIDAGAGDGGPGAVVITAERVTFASIPTADPHVSGEVYWDGNVLTKSTGP